MKIGIPSWIRKKPHAENDEQEDIVETVIEEQVEEDFKPDKQHVRKGRPRNSQRVQREIEKDENYIRDRVLIDLCLIIGMKPVAPDVKITRSRLQEITKPEMIELISKRFDVIEELRRKNAITYCENNNVFSQLKIN